MTRGALIFAFNNERTDYLAMAAWNANRIKQYLGIPVALVTDSPDHGDASKFDKVIVTKPESGGQRYFEDYDATITWNNASRPDAYTLSPWDQTLLLDADYVVNSSNLKILFESQEKFLCFRHAFDMTRQDYLLPTFGRHNFPMWWATVIMFRRSVLSEHIFNVMHMVKTHWQHYKDIYGIERTAYRNDYALSIAINLTQGHTLVSRDIPWAMPSILPKDIVDYDGNIWSIHYQDQQDKSRRIEFRDIDFHAMGKHHLENVIENHR